MKILFISDIHGITKNLDKVRRLIEKNNFDKIVNLGDMYYCGLSIRGILEVDPNTVKDFLTTYQHKLLSLQGNCDSEVDIEKSEFPICRDLAMINVDDINIYCTHGHIYNINKNSKFVDGGILIYGHFHVPYIKKVDNMTYVCVGSISLPRDKYGPTYAIYENRKISIYSLMDDSIVFESEV